MKIFLFLRMTYYYYKLWDICNLRGAVEASLFLLGMYQQPTETISYDICRFLSLNFNT